jgi:thioredoxin 1
MASAHIKTLTDSNFAQEVFQSPVPVMVDFWAEWCAPCKMIAPVLDELAEEFAGKFTIGKVDIDQFQNLAAKYNVMSIPTLLIFKKGEVVDQMVGGRSKRDLKAAIERSLA